MSEATQVFVRVVDEAVDVWVPVRAQRRFGNVYRIIDQPYDRDTETWEFGPGDDVVCTLVDASGGKILAATARHVGDPSASHYPLATVAGGILSVRFLSTAVARSIDVACIIDLTDFADVLGVEIMDWSRQLSGGVLSGPSPSGRVRWAYDQETDALYIHVLGGHSSVQRKAIAKVRLDSDQRVVRVDVPIPPVTR